MCELKIHASLTLLPFHIKIQGVPILVGMIEGYFFVRVYLDDKFCHTKSNRLKRKHEKQYNFNFNCNSIIISIVIQC